MNKSEYLKALESNLDTLPYKEVKEILDDISDHFDAGIASGKSEEDVAQGLGDVKALADSFKDGVKLPEIIRKKAKKAESASDGPNGLGVLFVVIFNIFVGIPAWLSLFVLLLSLALITLVAVSLVIFLIYAVIAGLCAGFGATMILLAITLIFASIFLFAITILGIKYFVKGTGSYIRWNKQVWYEGLEG